MNACMCFDVRRYVYYNSYVQLKYDLSNAISEKFEFVEDEKKTFLFLQLEREYKLFTPVFKYHLHNSTVNFFEYTPFQKKCLTK